MNNSPRNQQGAVLIVALVMLLIITLLAVSSTRESALETRMTANFVAQQQQLNYAESVLREGEGITLADPRYLNANSGGTCDVDDKYCLYADAAKYGHDFGDCDSSSTHGLASDLLNSEAYDGSSTEPPGLRWYAIRAVSRDAEGQTENPEYGAFLGVSGATYRHEVSALARDGDTETCTVLRSVVSKYFDEGPGN